MHIYLHMYVILSECVCVCARAEWEKERQALEDDAFYYAPWSSQRGGRPPQGLKKGELHQHQPLYQAIRCLLK